MLLLLSRTVGYSREFITQKEIPDILKELVNSFVALLNQYCEKSHAQDIVNQDGSPLQKLVVTLIHHRHNQKQALNSSIKNDVYFTVAQQCFPGHPLADARQYQTSDKCLITPERN